MLHAVQKTSCCDGHAAVLSKEAVEQTVNAFATVFTENTWTNSPLPDKLDDVILEVVEFREHRLIWELLPVNRKEALDINICTKSTN